MIKTNCDYCGKEILRKPSQYYQYEHHFCCRKCSYNYQSEESKKNIKYIINEKGCHICTSHYKDKDGYPKIMNHSKLVNISRFIYEKYYGKIPKGMVIRHKCDNPECINIEHLELGTFYDNNHDTLSRGRTNFVKGEKHYLSKLNEEKVRFILKNPHISNYKLAEMFNVGRKTIEAVKKRRTWKHIKI